MCRPGRQALDGLCGLTDRPKGLSASVTRDPGEERRSGGGYKTDMLTDLSSCWSTGLEGRQTSALVQTIWTPFVAESQRNQGRSRPRLSRLFLLLSVSAGCVAKNSASAADNSEGFPQVVASGHDQPGAIRCGQKPAHAKVAK